MWVKRRRATTKDDYETWAEGVVCPTLNVMDNTSDGHATVIALDPAPRRLTPRECERLQGFPDDWTAQQPDSARFKQLGNAVAVPVVEWIIGRLVEVDRERA